METISIIDVTVIEPRLRHPTIFESFDSLSPGEALVIHNDHDPQPLYYQLLGLRGETFRWEYLEEGPVSWKVRISKFGADEPNPTIGELVAKDYRKADVFKKYGLDFCCGGKKTVQEACTKKGLDVVQIEKELSALDEVSVLPSEDYNNWDVAFLADFIENTHHKYIRKAVPVLYEYTQKVAKVHGDSHPEAVQVAELFLIAADELNRHICKEEEILFPYFRHLQTAASNGMLIDQPPFGSVENPIAAMEGEHDAVGVILEKIRSITDDYTPPADACATYKVSYLKLKEFEDDLHKHIHLENNILFRKAIALESELK